MSEDAPEGRPVLELRTAQVTEVRAKERIVTLLVAPYEKPTDNVVYRGQVWRESFARGAFDGIESRAAKIRVNREHRKGNTVGKVVQFHPDAHEGLVAEVRVAPTALGDETLVLAEEDMISPSIGFRINKGSDQELNPRSRPPTRYIRRAFVDHIALVEDPAYDEAGVLAVRESPEFVDAASLPPLNTPRLDEWTAYLASRRAGVAS